MSATVQNHVQKYSFLYSDVILQFVSDLFMGGSITGKQNEGDAFDFYLVYKNLTKEGGTNLRKWLSNSKSLQEKIAECESKYREEEDHEILVVKWVRNSDELVFNIRDLIDEYNNITPLTKLVILKFVANIFDPNGVLSPAVTCVKLHFQKLCGVKIDWYLPLPEELATEWKKLLYRLMKLKHVYISCFYLDNYS